MIHAVESQARWVEQRACARVRQSSWRAAKAPHVPILPGRPSRASCLHVGAYVAASEILQYTVFKCVPQFSLVAERIWRGGGSWGVLRKVQKLVSKSWLLCSGEGSAWTTEILRIMSMGASIRFLWRPQRLFPANCVVLGGFVDVSLKSIYYVKVDELPYTT